MCKELGFSVIEFDRVQSGWFTNHYKKTKKISLGWQGGARVGHRYVGSRSLCPVVAGEHGVLESLFVEAGRKP